MNFINPEKKSLLVLMSVMLLFACAGFVSATVSGITVTVPNGGEKWSGTHSINWTATCSDPANDYVDIQWTVGSGWTTIASSQYCNASTYSWDTTSPALSDNGNYQIKILDTGTPATNDVSDAIFTVDNTVPTPSNINKNDSTIKVDDVVLFYANWSDSLAGLSHYIFSWNHSDSWVNDSAVALTDWSNITKTVTKTGKPEINWKIYANDSANNWNDTGTQTFTVANTAPTQPTLTNPANDAKVSSITMNWSASTDADLDTVNYYVIVNGTQACYTADLYCTYDPDGAYYQWNVTAYDGTANGTTSASRYYTYDKIAPASFNFVSPTEGDYANKSFDWYYVNVTFTEVNPDTCWLDNGTTNTSMSRSGTNCYVNITSQSEETYTYKVWANDTSGNWGVSSERHITLDTTKPVVLSASASPDPAKTGAVTITVTFTESGSGMNTSVTPTVTFLYPNSTEASVSESSYSGTTWIGTTTVALENDGTNATIKVSGAADNAINTMDANTAAGTFTIDTTNPTTNLVNTTFTTTDNTPSITFNYTDDLSATASCVLYFNDTISITTNATTANATNTILTPSEISDGNYTVYVNCTDLAGNIDKSGEITIRIDATAPTLSTLTLSDTTPVKAGNVTFTLDFGEAMDQTLNTTVTLNGSSVTAIGWQSSTQWTGWYNFTSSNAEESYTITVTAAKDTAGNTMAANTDNTFVFDMTSPTLSTLTLNDTTPVKAGNVTFTLVFNEVMDNGTKPTVKMNTTEITEIGWNAANTTWTGWYNFTTQTEGNYTIHVTLAKDQAANVMAEDTSNWFVLDTTDTAGSVTFSSYAWETSKTVTFSCSDTGGTGCVGTYWYLTNVSGSCPTDRTTYLSTASTTVEVITDNNNYVCLYVEDNAGNTNITKSNETLEVDTGDPSVAVDYPTATLIYLKGGSAVDINWTATDDNMATTPITIEYYNGTAWVSETTGHLNNGTYSWTVPSLNIATAKVRVNATDKAGNTASDESDNAFTIDSTAPTVVVTSPNGSEVWEGGSSHAITWTATDTVGLAATPITIEYYNGTAWVSQATGETDDGTYTWTVPSLNIATAKVRVNATDLAGNEGNDESDAVFTIDSTDPTTPAIATPSDQTIDAANIIVYLDTNSTDTNWNTYQIYSTATPTWTNTVSTNATGFTFTLTQDINNTLWIRGKDDAENIGANASTWVLEDSIEPTTSVNNATDSTTTLTTLDGTEHLADTNIIVTATVTESGSGISDVTGYFTTNGSTPTTGSTLFAMTDAATSTGTIPGTSISSGQTVKFIVVTTDNAANINTTGVKSFIIGTSTLSLTNNAWNLVSVPLVLDNTTFTKVFPTTVSKFAWNGSAWSTPTTLTPYNGYWVYNTDGTTIQLDYKVYSSVQSLTTKSLVAGWNLIGQPSTSTMNVSSALSSLTTKYSHVYEHTPGVGWKVYIRSEGDSGNTVAGRFYQIQSGKGYWIFMTEATTFGGGEINPIE